MVDTTGLSLTIFAAFFFGTYFVPLKRSKNVNPFTYQAFVGIGALIVGIIASFLLNIPFQDSIIAFIPGIMWAAANFIGVNAVMNSGISWLSISQATVLLTSFLWGVLFFREPFQSLPLAIVGISLLMLGILLVSIGGLKDGNKKRGFAFFVIAGIIWGSIYVAPLSFRMPARSIIPSMMLAVFLSGLVLFLIGRKFQTSNASNSIFSGTLWAIGNVAATLSIDLIGIALAGPLPQLAMLVSVAWGTFYFKEVEGNKKILRMVVGGLVLVLGAILLAFAK